jgi:hypothetical protein
MEDDLASGAPTGVPRRVACAFVVAIRRNHRMSAFEIVAQLGIAEPDQSTADLLTLLLIELVAKARHHARDESSAIAIAACSRRDLVFFPETLAHSSQEIVNVVGQLNVLASTADLHHAPILLFQGPKRVDPDHIDEEMLLQDRAQDRLGLAHSAGRASKLTMRIAFFTIEAQLIDVVPQHQSLGKTRGRLGLVFIRALGEGQEFSNPVENRMASVASRRICAGPGIDSTLPTDLLKDRPMRWLVRPEENLVHELMRHLMLQDFNGRPPAILDEQRAGNFDSCSNASGRRNLLSRPRLELYAGHRQKRALSAGGDFARFKHGDSRVIRVVE